MSAIDDIRQKYEELDEVDRKNLMIGIFGAIVILYMLYSLSQTADTLSGIFGSGVEYANNTVSGLNNLQNIS